MKKRIIISLGICLSILLFVFVILLLHRSESEHVKNHIVYSKKDLILEDTFNEKNNNPEAVYQKMNGVLYLLESGNLFAISKNDMSSKLKTGVRSFVVSDDHIYYCAENGFGSELRRCLIDGTEDELLEKNVDVCVMESNENELLLSGHIEQWSIAKYDLKSKTLKVLEIEGNTSPKHSCFFKDSFILADTYDISCVNTKTGKVKELISFYGDVRAYAEVTFLYVHNNKIYYGLSDLDNDKKHTGIWRMDMDGKGNERIDMREAREICFINDEYYILR